MSAKVLNIVVSTIVNGKQQTISQVYKTTTMNLEDLADVLITGPNIGDTIVWNGTDWVNAPAGAQSSVATGLVAIAGGQAAALPVTKAVNIFSTVPSNGGFQLPAAVANMDITVVNNGAHNLLPYPINGGSDAFIGQSANATLTIPIPPGGSLRFACGSPGIIQYF